MATLALLTLFETYLLYLLMSLFWIKSSKEGTKVEVPLKSEPNFGFISANESISDGFTLLDRTLRELRYDSDSNRKLVENEDFLFSFAILARHCFAS